MTDPSEGPLHVEPLSEAHLENFRALFEAASAPCFCRYWHATGTKNDWLDRCANRPEENFAEQAAAVRAGDPSAIGLVARNDAGVVGWIKVAPRTAVPKITGLPVYRTLPFEEGTWVIGCFLVHPSWRRHGVARALVEGAEVHVARCGGRFIEAHPRRSDVPLHDEEAFRGPEELFLARDYAAVHDVSPYPVYRKVLTPRIT